MTRNRLHSRFSARPVGTENRLLISSRHVLRAARAAATRPARLDIRNTDSLILCIFEIQILWSLFARETHWLARRQNVVGHWDLWRRARDVAHNVAAASASAKVRAHMHNWSILSHTKDCVMARSKMRHARGEQQTKLKAWRAQEE